MCHNSNNCSIGFEGLYDTINKDIFTSNVGNLGFNNKMVIGNNALVIVYSWLTVSNLRVEISPLGGHHWDDVS